MKTLIVCLALFAAMAPTYAQSTNKPKTPLIITGKPIYGNALVFSTSDPVKVSLNWTPFRDRQGSMYGIIKPRSTSLSSVPFKLYKIPPNGEPTLYFDSAANNMSMSMPPTGAKYAFDLEGNFFWQSDSVIRKLSNSGQVLDFAGTLSNNRDARDGKGDQAVLPGHLYQFKFNPFDGCIYFNERNDHRHAYETFEGKILDESSAAVLLRKLCADSTVTTLKYPDGALFLESAQDFFFAPNGEIVYTRFQPEGSGRSVSVHKWDRKDPPKLLFKFNGGLFSGPDGQRGRWTLGDISKVRIPNPSDIVFNSKMEMIIYDADMRRFAKLVGDKVVAYSGTSDDTEVREGVTLVAKVSADVDGAASVAQYLKVYAPITIDAQDNIILRSKSSVRKIAPNGSVTTIMKNNPRKTAPADKEADDKDAN